MDLRPIITQVERLSKAIPFKQILIVADVSVIPAKILQVAKRSFHADIYIPKNIKIRDDADNKIHNGSHVSVENLVRYVWDDEQLIVIGHKIDNAISIGDGENFDISYKEFVENLENYM